MSMGETGLRLENPLEELPTEALVSLERARALGRLNRFQYAQGKSRRQPKHFKPAADYRQPHND